MSQTAWILGQPLKERERLAEFKEDELKFNEPFPDREPGKERDNSRWTINLLSTMAGLRKLEDLFFEEAARLEPGEPVPKKEYTKDNPAQGTIKWLTGIVTWISRASINTALIRLERNGLVERTGKEGRAFLWRMTDKGEKAFQYGMKKRFSRRQDFSNSEMVDMGRDPVVFLKEVSHLNLVLKADYTQAKEKQGKSGLGWKPHLRYEVFRSVPLYYIRWAVARAYKLMNMRMLKNFFAYTYACLLGGKTGEMEKGKFGRPVRSDRRVKEHRRVLGWLKQHGYPNYYDDKYIYALEHNPKAGDAVKWVIETRAGTISAA